MFIIFDTETTGLPKKWNAPITDTDNWPRCVQIAWQLHDEYGKLIEHQDFLIKPEGSIGSVDYRVTSENRSEKTVEILA